LLRISGAKRKVINHVKRKLMYIIVPPKKGMLQFCLDLGFKGNLLSFKPC
jgi:hypothetical protein